jgi:peptidoglycan/LPS O-acetylase OafA/YrhL
MACRRIFTKMKQQNWIALDGLRGLSILSVVAIHLWAHASRTSEGVPIKLLLDGIDVDLTWIFSTGHNAVVVFFVLSGFLLYRHWLEAAPDLAFGRHAKIFLHKRARRILPGWIFFTAIYLILVVMVGRHRFGSELTASNVLANLTFLAPLANFLPHPEKLATSLDLLPGTWSLNAEMWFYAALPMLAWVLNRLGIAGQGLLLLSFSGLLARLWMGSDPPFILRQSVLGVIDAFILGMVVAVASVRAGIPPLAGWLFPLGAIYYVALCAGHVLPGPDHAFQLCVASAMMVSGLVAPGDRPWSRFLSWRPLVYAGHISFSMFLCNILIVWHIVLPLSQWAGVSTDAQRFLWNFGLGLPLIFVLSHFSFKWIEHPFMWKLPGSLPLMAARAVALAACVLGISLVASIGAYANLGHGAEFRSSTISTLAGSRFQPGPITSPAVSAMRSLAVDSATQSAVIRAEQDNKGVIRVSSPGLSAADTWANIALPVNADNVQRGSPLTMAATLVVEQSSDLQVCLGVFDGKEDVCTEKSALAIGRSALTVSAVPQAEGLLQFKLNIFPGTTAAPFAFRLEGLTVEAAAN